MNRPLVNVCLAALTATVVACGGEASSTADSATADAVRADSAPVRPSAGVEGDTPYIYATDVGIGDLRAGMSLDEARRIVPDLQLVPGSDSLACSYLQWPSAPAGVLLMFDQGRLARVDIDSVGVRTAAGAQVGDAETRLDSLYAGRVSKQPHKYTDGQYYVITAARAADSLYRIIFEVENARVTRYRVGVTPQVEYVEGCS